MRWVVLTLLATACGDNLGMIESGGRLEAIVEVGGDEDAVAIAHYHDTDLDLECTFQRDPEGAWRCLPRAVAEIVGYADADCTQPRFECRDCAKAAAVTIEDACGGPVAMPVTLTPSLRPLFVRVGELCLHADFPPGMYGVAESQPLSSYVEATFEDHLVTHELGTRTLVADDGTRTMFHHAYERAGARDCAFFGGVAGPCVPGTTGGTERGSAYFFTDDTCTSRAAFSVKPDDAGACPPPTHIRFEGEVHRLAAIGDRAFERSAIDSSCGPTRETDLAFFSIGAIDDALPRAEVIALGTGEARPLYYAAEGKPIAFAERWVLSDDFPCTPLETVAGRRCIGRSLSVFPGDTRYADVTCSIEIVPNPLTDLYALRWVGATTARDVTERSVVASVHALRAFPATEMYELRDGFCTLSPDPVVLMAFVGAPLDLQKFPSVERRRAY